MHSGFVWLTKCCTEVPTDLLNVPGRPTVVLSDDPLDPLLEVEPVDAHHVMEVLGQCVWGPAQQDPSLLEHAPGASDWCGRGIDGEFIRRCPGGLQLASTRQHSGNFLRFLMLRFGHTGTFPSTAFSRLVWSTLSSAALWPAADDGGCSGWSDWQWAASSWGKPGREDWGRAARKGLQQPLCPLDQHAHTSGWSRPVVQDDILHQDRRTSEDQLLPLLFHHLIHMVISPKLHRMLWEACELFSKSQ